MTITKSDLSIVDGGGYPKLYSEGVFGTNSALEFSSSYIGHFTWAANSSDEYIETPTLTFCTWVFLTGSTDYATILGYNREPYTSIRVTGYQVDNRTYDNIHWSSINPPNERIVYYTYQLQNKGWHHLAFVKDSSLTYTIFIDGRKVASSQGTSIVYQQFNQLRILDIGNDGFNSNAYFYGKLDDYLVSTDVLFTEDFTLPTKSIKKLYPNANYVVDLSTRYRSKDDILKVY